MRFIKKHFWLLLIILVASGLRFYSLAQVPAGMTWDEAAIGYNGQAVITTRRDEWLQRLPVSFRSFGDYKAPLAIYINGVFTQLFGLNLWAVRLPFALAGVMAVWGGYLLVTQIFKFFQPKFQVATSRKYSLLFSLLLALSPWHLHFSRAGFESGLALSFIIWGLYFLFFWLNRPLRHWLVSNLSFFAGSTLLVMSLYTYHSAKIFIPLMGLLILNFTRKILAGRLIVTLINLSYSALLAVPLVKDTIYGQGLTRAGTLVFSHDLEPSQALWKVITNFATHLSPEFLVLGQTDTLRHGAGRFGVLLLPVLIVICYRLYWDIRSLVAKKGLEALAVFSYGWIIIGLAPAALGLIAPQANRALLALPGFLLLAILGLDRLLGAFRAQAQLILIFIFSFYLANFGVYLNHYYTSFAQNSAQAFNEGYLEAFSLTHEYELGKGGKPEVSQIVFTSDYGQPYIYALFVRKTNPIWYRGGSLIKYHFTSEINLGDLERDNTLVVASAKDKLPASKADHLIYDSAGNIRFKLYYTQ